MNLNLGIFLNDTFEIVNLFSVTGFAEKNFRTLFWYTIDNISINLGIFLSFAIAKKILEIFYLLKKVSFDLVES